MTWEIFVGKEFLGTVPAETRKAAMVKARKAARILEIPAKWRSRVTVKRSNDNSAARRKNPTKAQKLAKARKASVERRAAAALRKYLKIQNPAMKAIGAAVQKLKRGVLKITPIKAKRGRK